VPQPGWKTLNLILIHFRQYQQALQPVMARHEPERGRHLTVTHALQPLKTRPDGFAQVAGIGFALPRLWKYLIRSSRGLLIWDGMALTSARMTRSGLKRCCSRHFGTANQPVLLHFTLDRITGFIEEIAFPDLIAQRLTAQLLLLVIRSVKSDQV
jgi:hypothetical protein